MVVYQVSDPQGNILLGRCTYSAGFLFRMVGLLRHKGLDHDEGIWLKPCKQIHMFGMRFAIDVIFLDQENKVVHICDSIEPWKVSRYVRRARSAIECQAGLVRQHGLKLGQQLTLTKAE